MGGEGDDDVGHDVGQYQLVSLLGQLGSQGPVAEHVPRTDGIAAGADAVHGGVFIGHAHGLGVDVHPRGFLRAQQ